MIPDSRRRAAFALVLTLAIVLAVGLAPVAVGLIGVPVLYVAVEPVHRWLARHTSPRVGATVMVALVVLVLVVIGGFAVGLIVTEAGRIAGSVMQSPIATRLSGLRLGRLDLGAQIAALGSKVVVWIGSSAFGFIGTATRAALNLTIACLGLYYLLLRPGATWGAVSPYIPFSAGNTEKLRQRFGEVTRSGLIGTGLSALLIGVLTGLGFVAAGLPNATLWGTVTVVFAILPVLGSGLVWGPGAIALLLGHRPVAAVLLAVWGVAIVGNVDYVIRPIVSKRWGKIHPLITLIGALVGVPYLGILGLLIGPLALSYFFELINMYREEYVPA